MKIQKNLTPEQCLLFKEVPTVQFISGKEKKCLKIILILILKVHKSILNYYKNMNKQDLK